MRRALLAAMVAAIMASATGAILAKRGPQTQEITFYIYDREARPAKPPAGGTREGYKVIAKWDSTVTYYYNPQNDDELPAPFVETALAQATQQWDDNTNFPLANAPILDDSASFNSYMNTKNEVCFGNYPTSGVIAVCRMWVTGGKPSSRRIVEFDLMFDTDYTWGDATTQTGQIMDLQNIATHELGHGIAGLDDIYDDAWVDLTMYGYSDYRETSKRTLEQGDIGGLWANYGQ